VPWDDLPGLLARPRGRHLLVSTYPSGHAARATFLLLTAALSLPRRLAPVSVGIAVLLSLTVALQRVHAEAHSGSDVVGGLLLGGAAALAVFAVPIPRERPGAGHAPGEAPTGRAGAPPTGRRRNR
jgi:membrane-associated phospholipid phosphatase